MKIRDKRDTRYLLILALIFILLTAGIIVAGYRYYANYAANYRVLVENQLSSIAELKTGELAHWRQERVGDAGLFNKNPVFSALVERYFENAGDAEAEGQLRIWLGRLQDALRYERVMLLDNGYAEKMVVPEGPEQNICFVSAGTSAILQSGQVAFEDFYFDEVNEKIYLKVMVPILAPTDGSRVIGFLAMRIDPADYLYPMLQRWPTPSATAETLIVRRDGTDVLFLNELRFQQDTALKLRIPLDKIELPSVRGALGYEGITEGRDYRGAEVIAAVRSLPDSPWILVARMDTAEVYAPLTQMRWVIMVLIGALLTCAGAGVGLVWRRRSQLFYKQRAEAAEALRESDAKFEKAFSTSPDSMSITRLADGLCVAVNGSFTRLMGYEEGEIVGKSILAMNIWSNLADRQKMAEGLRAKGAVDNLEAIFLTKTGKPLHGLMSAAIIDLNGVAHILNTTRDISERKRMEEELREESWRLQSIIEGTHVGTWEWNVQTGETVFNEVWAQIIGYTLAELSPISIKTWEASVHPDDMKQSDELLERHFSGELPYYDCECRVKHKDGHWVWVLDRGRIITRSTDGKPLMMFGTHSDITERKQAERALSELSTYNRSLIEASLDSLVTIDEAGKISDVNIATEQITGFSRQDLIGTDFLDYFTEPEKAREGYQQTFKDGIVRDYPLGVRHRDGHITAVLYNASVYRDKSGKIRGVFAAARDITARKQMEDKLKKTFEELRTSNDELERFTYTISHDLKSPLVTIKTFLGYLKQDMPGLDAGKVEKDMLFMEGAADKMSRLLDELLEMSRIGRAVNPPVAVTLGELAQEALDLLAGGIRERGVAVQVSQETLSLYGDRPRLVEIWQNLLENAVKFMGGQASPRIDIGIEKRGKDTIFFVRDNGMGIDPRYKSRVFNLFDKLDAKTEGTGLGLAIVRRIVGLYKGTTWFESAGEGQGSCFFFTLPAALQDQSQGERT